MRKFRLFVLYPLLAIIVIIVAALLYVRYILPNIPVQNIKIELTAKRIQRGDYLVNKVAMCLDCHAQRDYSKFTTPVIKSTRGLGGQKWVLPVGTFTAKNLTPYHLKDWSDGQIYRAITSGVDKNGETLFPLMPWINYAQLDKEDIFSIIAYLRTLKPVESHNPAHILHFPINFIINLMPQPPYHRPVPARSDSIAYGKYIITAAACLDCHTPIDKGQPVPGMDYAGGFEFKIPTGGTVRSANLTPDKETGIGTWSRERFISTFKKYTDSSYVPTKVDSNKFNTTMPWITYSKMDSSDLAAIFTYLKSLKPVKNEVIKFTPDK